MSFMIHNSESKAITSVGTKLNSLIFKLLQNTVTHKGFLLIKHYFKELMTLLFLGTRKSGIFSY